MTFQDMRFDLLAQISQMASQVQGQSQQLCLEGDTTDGNDTAWQNIYVALLNSVVSCLQNELNFQNVKLATFKSSH